MKPLSEEKTDIIIDIKKDASEQIGYNTKKIVDDISSTSLPISCPLIFCELNPTPVPVPVEFTRLKFQEFTKNWMENGNGQFIKRHELKEQLLSVIKPTILNGLTQLTLSFCWKVWDSIFSTDIFHNPETEDENMSMIWSLFEKLKLTLNYDSVYRIFENMDYTDMITFSGIHNELRDIPEKEYDALLKGLSSGDTSEILNELKEKASSISDMAQRSEYIANSKAHEAYATMMTVMASSVDLVCREIYCTEKFYKLINLDSSILSKVSYYGGMKYVNYGILSAAINLIVTNFAEVGFAAIHAEVMRESFYASEVTIAASNLKKFFM